MGGMVTKQAISKYEGGVMMPGSPVVNALAEALGVRVDYLFRPFTYGTGNLDVSFRKKSNVGTRETAALKVQIQDDIERRLEIEEILGIKRMPLPVVGEGVIQTAEEMRRCAAEVRRAWGLGRSCIANMQETLEANGVTVVYTPASEGFDGVSGTVNDTFHVVVLNSNKRHVERHRLTAAHELGHLLCNQRFSDRLSPHTIENLCNDFASELLLPGDVMEQYFARRQHITTQELVAIGEAYGISADAIVYKLHSMGIISEKRYRSYYICKNQDKRMRETVEASRYKEYTTNRMEARVYGALAQGLITAPKAAELLNTSVENIIHTQHTI